MPNTPSRRGDLGSPGIIGATGWEYDSARWCGTLIVRVHGPFSHEQLSALLMTAAIALALVAANSPLASLYTLVHDASVHVRVGPLVLEGPLVHWINEGLMVIFFLIVGLEIKQQFFEEHLSSGKRAALPGFAALGGMIMPALIYVGLNRGDPAALEGWAIPTATDIVLVLGLLSLLGRRVPTGLKIFLTALAIFDDIGAVLIIAVFYGEIPSILPLLLAIVAAAGLVAVNWLDIVHRGVYVALGLVLWLAMLKGGLEAALAGVIIALAVPLHVRACRRPSPRRATERRLHPWSPLLVVAVFAFFNAGIPIDTAAFGGLFEPVPLGIIAGLFLGKQLGIVGARRAAVRLGLYQLLNGIGWARVDGAGLIAGIGLTMSLFVATLAFDYSTMVAFAKLAVLLASGLSASVGLAVMARATAGGIPESSNTDARARTASAQRGAES